MILRSVSVAILLAGAPNGAAAGDAVVATVNGEPITRERFVDELLIRHGEAVLEDMIRQRAVEQEMERARVTVAKEEVDAELSRQERDFALRGRSLDEMVAEKYRMSMEGYREIVRRWLLIRKLIIRRENPAEDDVMLWFYRNRERYDTPAEYTVRHIFIARKDPRTGRERGKAEVERRIAQVREGLVRGEDFARLARRYTDDLVTHDKEGRRLRRPRPKVELGTVNERAARFHLEPAFVDAMVLLRPGQSGGPVPVSRGFHFLQVTARKEGRRARYEDIRARVRMEYLDNRAELQKEVFLRELMERTKVTRSFEPPVRAPKDRAAP